MKSGDPWLSSWPSLDAASHGGGQGWTPGAYDPETNLYIFGTGNPTPAHTPGRGDGGKLGTCTLIAVGLNTGEKKWWYQTSPHDTHDWESAPVAGSADLTSQGKMR